MQYHSQREFIRVHIGAELATVRELRRDENDKSQQKADLGHCTRFVSVCVLSLRRNTR